MSEFESALTVAAPWLHEYGYPVLALAIAIEGIGIPAPGGMLMAAAALLAGKGEMSLTAVLITAWSAAVVGDNLGYWIGRRGGRRLLLRAGINRRRLRRFDGFFRRFGAWLILFGRFFDGTRQLDGLVAGGLRLPWLRFFIADLIGSGLWVATWVVGLYAFDHHPIPLHRLLLHLNPWVAGAALTSLAIALVLLFRRAGPVKKASGSST
ncbi:DedA family protein [Thiocystis violacea]|uniref:DedA family protein n=1 Tax=Thiocystis violacea TaxID=13725 RepID=UPI0019032EF4|nr:VTT domain-containing protein [Thiocystis violacea]MBK1720723.1 hypothetical protein [Thiocystis violacea]